MSIVNIKLPSEDEMKEVENNYLNWLLSNENNFSFWFDKISKHMTEIYVPKSVIIKIPNEMLESLFMEKEEDITNIKQFIETDVMLIINQNFKPNSELFIKNGCYSGKFSFDLNCHIKEITVESIFEHFQSLNYESLMFDTGGNLELIVREYIPQSDELPSIYNGMPIRPEIRVFYDFTKHVYEYDTYYLDFDYCYERISDNKIDGEVYKNSYQKQIELYNERRNKYKKLIENELSKVTELQGLWSVDFIMEKDRIIFIDAAIGSHSAYYKPDFNKEE